MGKQFGIILTVIIGAIIVIAGALVLSLYIFPNMNLFGVKSVYIRNQFTNYYGADIEQIFDGERRNIIIESKNTPVYIRLRSIGQGDENTITVFEDANGISFNSVNRTQLNFLQEYRKAGAGAAEVFTRIQVEEPVGAVARTSRIYLNLKDDDITPYNFILNTGASPVSFEHDKYVGEMYIDRLVVNGTGSVVFQKPSADEVFDMTVGEIEVNSATAAVDCSYDILRSAYMYGNTRNVTLGRVGVDTAAQDGGALMIEGTGFHNVKADYVRGLVMFDCPTGSLTIGETESTLDVRTNLARISANTVRDLEAVNYFGSVNVARVNGEANIYMETGALTLGGRGAGSGVVGNVTVNPDKNLPKREGTTSVFFADGSEGNFLINAVDGNVFVSKARAGVEINVAARGIANVTLEIADLIPDPLETKIERMVFADGSRDPKKTGGNVTLRLLDRTAAFDLYIEATYERANYFDDTFLENSNRTEDGTAFANPPMQIGGGGEPLIYIRTHSRFELR